MGRISKNPVKFVISFRVNHKEKEALELMAEKMGLSISGLIRTNLEPLTDGTGIQA